MVVGVGESKCSSCATEGAKGKAVRMGTCGAMWRSRSLIKRVVRAGNQTDDNDRQQSSQRGRRDMSRQTDENSTGSDA